MNLYLSPRQVMTNMVGLFVTLAELLLALRVILKFAVAETDTSFVQWVFGVTDPLLDPFREIFTSGQPAGSWILDWPALFAMAIYAAAGYLLVTFVDGFATRRK